MKLADSVMAAKTSEGSIKWQLCYDISARTWWMVSWQEPKQFFPPFLFLLSPHFLREKNFPPCCAHAKRKTQKDLCFVKIPFLLHIQFLVMSTLFLDCLLALHSDNGALLVLWLSSSFVVLFNVVLIVHDVEDLTVKLKMKFVHTCSPWTLVVCLFFPPPTLNLEENILIMANTFWHFCTSGSSFLHFHLFSELFCCQLVCVRKLLPCCFFFSFNLIPEKFHMIWLLTRKKELHRCTVIPCLHWVIVHARSISVVCGHAVGRCS